MAKVFFIKDLNKVAELFDLAGIAKIINKNDSVALKIHFGEPGNTAFLKPHQVKTIAEKVINLGGKPFYTDCNTLYKGRRAETKTHLEVAKEHGYTLEEAGAQAIIPAEDDCESVEIGQKHFKRVHIGNNARKSEAIIAVTHFKGHELTGFGGALKNLGMGFGTRIGKLKMHQDCKNCDKVKHCEKNKTIEACWVGSPAFVAEKIVEYAYGAIKDKKTAYFNFIINVSEACDCYPHNSEPIVPDIGVLASFDPVATDQASVDLVNQTEGRINSRNKFRAIYSNVDWAVQLKYAEEIGLGSRKYELIQID
ncbi:hypothetical protein A2291_06340 [candidate division WOR-1 bacterium RIFOXYB2_FULL_42_35]|uniref:DUF362 domain-containing protein n=1 Tax=candidate division WOR-1 bacterium RIFOXYC2_FULL_41_25 TaxID=1802586 RepID=A0A1F4TRR3_UNCSA|nr:MAG: hypothetical protein A2247_00045 [candidate division WOR-1 bacterium RIFOXYA2_FULL_41_14]OGC27406.1 MAG: hypothetical protein A2291_06340 [candidate division WOR-1 bacterium RIFOXYB2_FULL_42_35]OGC35432.1 MAG: hypothetical protein A2462_03000 [candidate division WOR-1 bacterium RIFOXYC2_FULL_41_25]OGC43784.1 MAG: hypothetical protein A2548_07905 [candidate division WOR-1 bacterium RIFOXYD2_FULL_41_8]